MVKAPIYTIKGTKIGELTLPRDVFEVKSNLNLLAQAVHVYEERAHVGLRKTKTRSEVNRTTKKVYKQKGTGGARHGSRRANLFVGGGVALGPRPERRILNLPTALKNKAKAVAFSVKAKEEEIVAVGGLSNVAKTKEISGFLAKLSKETGAKRFLFVLSENAKGALKYLRNLEKAMTVNYKEITAYDIWRGGTIILDQDIFKAEKSAKKVVKKPLAKSSKKPIKKIK